MNARSLALWSLAGIASSAVHALLLLPPATIRAESPVELIPRSGLDLDPLAAVAGELTIAEAVPEDLATIDESPREQQPEPVQRSSKPADVTAAPPVGDVEPKAPVDPAPVSAEPVGRDSVAEKGADVPTSEVELGPRAEHALASPTNGTEPREPQLRLEVHDAELTLNAAFDLGIPVVVAAKDECWRIVYTRGSFRVLKARRMRGGRYELRQLPQRIDGDPTLYDEVAKRAAPAVGLDGDPVLSLWLDSGASERVSVAIDRYCRRHRVQRDELSIVRVRFVVRDGRAAIEVFDASRRA